MRKLRRGANAIEFALTFPIFFFAFFALVEYGYYFYIRTYVLEATRIGTRIGALHHPEDPVNPAATVADLEISQRLHDGLGSECSEGSTSCVVTCEYDGTPSPDEALVCTASITHRRISGLSVPVPDVLNARVEILLEQQR